MKESNYDKYEPTKVSRLIQDFVIDKLSNWYIRLCRRRFWKGDYNVDKISAFQTLYECLEKIAIISSPIAPFFMERLFIDLNNCSCKKNIDSVHLTDFPLFEENRIDKDLEEKMDIAQKLTTMVLSLRKKHRIRVRQPLKRIMIPVINDNMRLKIKSIKDILLSELNIKEIEFISSDSEILTKKIKPNYRNLGPKYGKDMGLVTSKINQFTIDDIKQIEKYGKYQINSNITIELSDVEIFSSEIPGWEFISQDSLTVALDLSLTDSLIEEGISRELVNRIQNIRKDHGYKVTDKINIFVKKNEHVENAINNNLSYICSETLAKSLNFTDKINDEVNINLVDNISVSLQIKKI